MWLLASLNKPTFFQDKACVHCPVLKLKSLDFDMAKALKMAQEAEGLIITSQEISKILDPLWLKLPKGKSVFCTGPKTQASMQFFYQGRYYLPQRFDQEGLVDVITQSQCRSFFYPKGKKIRSYLLPALRKINCQINTLDCYDIEQSFFTYDHTQSYEGIYFGSSRCVQAFYDLYPTLPCAQVYVPGFVTKAMVKKLFGYKTEVTLIPL